MPPLDDTATETKPAAADTATTTATDKAATDDKAAVASEEKAAAAKATEKSAAVTGESVLDEADPSAEDTKKVVAPADWPEDWRDKAVAHIKDEADRTKELKRLQRMKTPADMYKSYRALETKLATEYTRKPPENATDEQLKAWRKDQGLPESPDKYDLPKVEGYEWSEADQPLVKTFTEKMFGVNADQAQVGTALQVYAEMVAETKQAQFDHDKGADETCVDSLRAEWGNEYRSNLATAKRLLNDKDNFDPDLAKMLTDARAADGTRLVYNPALWKLLADLATDKYGAGAQITGDARAAASSRKAEIQKIMREDIGKYWANDGALDKELQAIFAQEEAAASGRRGKAAK